ncbi:MAG: hypothetical protein ACLQPH_05060 [Acidimicrobiales bacterium]
MTAEDKEIGFCLNCGRRIKQPKIQGRPRLYCSNFCRLRAYRDRQHTTWTVEAQ